MSKTKPTYRVLEARLAVAEPIVKALKNHEVDAVVGEENIAFLLLREVEEALRISDAGYRAMFGTFRRGHDPGRCSRFSLQQSQPEVLRDCGLFRGRIADQDLHWPYSSGGLPTRHE